MFAQMFAKSPLLIFPLIALVMFAGSFLVLAARALRQRPEERDARALMPLADDLEVDHGR